MAAQKEVHLSLQASSVPVREASSEVIILPTKSTRRTGARRPLMRLKNKLRKVFTPSKDVLGKQDVLSEEDPYLLPVSHPRSEYPPPPTPPTSERLEPLGSDNPAPPPLPPPRTNHYICMGAGGIQETCDVTAAAADDTYMSMLPVGSPPPPLPPRARRERPDPEGSTSSPAAPPPLPPPRPQARSMGAPVYSNMRESDGPTVVVKVLYTKKSSQGRFFQVNVEVKSLGHI